MTAAKENLSKTLIDFIIAELAQGKDIGGLKPDDDLLEDSLVDSLGIMRLIAFIEQQFGYVVPSEDVVIENFMTVSAIIDYLGPKLTENVD